MKILVIGGAGYIGSMLLEKLISAGHRVSLLDVFLYGDDSIKSFPGCSMVIKSDFRDTEALKNAMQNKDVVVHLAAIVGDQACDIDPRLTLDINYTSAVQCAKIAKEIGVKKFVFSSTCSVYGCNENMLNEASELNPVSLYAKSKIYAEEEIAKLAEDKKFTVLIPRFGTVYGISYRPRFDLVVNILTAKAILDKAFTVNGGSQWRPFLHVSDAAKGIAHLVQNNIKSGIYNVVSENYQIKEVGFLIQNLTNAHVTTIGDDRDKRDYKVSWDKIANTGYTAEKSVLDGIKEIMTAINEKKIEDYKLAKYSNLAYLQAGAIKILQDFKKV